MKKVLVVLFAFSAATAHAQLSIDSARWGLASGPSCDARAKMAAACNGKEFCQVYVDIRSGLCGSDPAYGRVKSLVVTYRCYGQSQKALSFPDGAQALLRCTKSASATPTPHSNSNQFGGRIGPNNNQPVYPPPTARPSKPENPISANPRNQFGGAIQTDLPRQPGKPPVVAPPRPEPGKPQSVQSTGNNLQILSATWRVAGGGASCNAKPQMSLACNGKPYCQVYVDVRSGLCGGDPAHGKVKNLEITYSCNGQSRPPLSFPDGAQAALRCP